MLPGQLPSPQPTCPAVAGSHSAPHVSPMALYGSGSRDLSQPVQLICPSFQLPQAQHVPPPDSGIGLSAHPDRSSCDGPCCMPPSLAVRQAHSPQPIGLITRRGSSRGGLGLSSPTAFVACCVDSGVLLPFGKNSHLSNLEHRYFAAVTVTTYELPDAGVRSRNLLFPIDAHVS